MANQFDLAMLGEGVEFEDQELAGFFSKLKKKVKKVVKKVKKVGSKLADPLKKVRSKLGRKILGNKNIEKLKKIERKLEPVKKAAKIAVATYFAGPFAGKIAGGALSKVGLTTMGKSVAAYGAKMGAGSVVKAVGKNVLQTGVKTAAQKALQKKAAQKQADATKKYVRDMLAKQLAQTIKDIQATFNPQIAAAKKVGNASLVSMLTKGMQTAIAKAREGYNRELKEATAATLEASMMDIAKYPNSYIQKLATDAQKHLDAAQKKAVQTAKKLQGDKNFQAAVIKQTADGKSSVEILQEWANSSAFKGAASSAAYEAVREPIYNQMIAEGMSPEDAAYYANSEAIKIANQETKDLVATVNSGGGLAKLALIAVPIAIAVMGG